jgi:PEP-CTERM motif
MSNVVESPTAAVPARKSNTTKLIHAAALAAALVPLGSVAVETAIIDLYCTSSTGGSGGCPSGTFSPPPTGPTTHTWGFFEDVTDPSTLLYTLQLTGTPTATFTLDLIDIQNPLDSLGIPGGTCIPILDSSSCSFFQIFNLTPGVTPDQMWQNGYEMTIAWFPNANPLSSALLNQSNTQIRRRPDGAPGFTDVLTDSQFFPSTLPGEDPGLSGRGDGFSTFTPFTIQQVPEPATLALLGVGISGLVYRKRRLKRRS